MTITHASKGQSKSREIKRCPKHIYKMGRERAATLPPPASSPSARLYPHLTLLLYRRQQTHRPSGHALACSHVWGALLLKPLCGDPALGNRNRHQLAARSSTGGGDQLDLCKTHIAYIAYPIYIGGVGGGQAGGAHSGDTTSVNQARWNSKGFALTWYRALTWYSSPARPFAAPDDPLLVTGQQGILSPRADSCPGLEMRARGAQAKGVPS